MGAPAWPGDHHDKHAAAARLGWRRKGRGASGAAAVEAPAVRVRKPRQRKAAGGEELTHYEALARHMTNPPRFELNLSRELGYRERDPGLTTEAKQAFRESYSPQSEARRRAQRRPEQIRLQAQILQVDRLLHPVTGGRVLEPADRKAARARLSKLLEEQRRSLPGAIAAELKTIRAEAKTRGETPAPKRARKPVRRPDDAVARASSELLAAQRAYAADQTPQNRARAKRAQAAYRAVVPAAPRSERNEVERGESYARRRREYAEIGKRRAYNVARERLHDKGKSIGPPSRRVTRQELRRIEHEIAGLRRGLAVRPVTEMYTPGEQARLRNLEGELTRKRAEYAEQERARTARHARLTTHQLTLASA